MDADTIILNLEKAIAPKNFTSLQKIIFKGSCDGLTYEAIAERSGFSAGYIREEGSKLLNELTLLIGQRVNKKNLLDVLKYWLNPKMSNREVVPFRKTNWGEAIDVGNFYGREAEQKELCKWIQIEGCRLVGIYGCQGMGKTGLAVKVAKQLYPKFERVFWQRVHLPLSLDQCLPTWLTFLAQDESPLIPSRFSDQLDYLVALLSQRRSLLILDGVDALFTPRETAAVFQPEYKNYGKLLQFLGTVKHNSCVLLTSREKLVEISTLEGEKLPVRSLKLTGVNAEVGALILKDKGLCTEQSGVPALVQQYNGNPIVLKMVSTTIQDLFGGNIATFLAQKNTLFPELKGAIDQLFLRLSDSEKAVVYWLATQQKPLAFSTLQKEIIPSFSSCTLQKILGSLEQRSFIQNISTKDQEPHFILSALIRDYILEQWLTSATQTPSESQPVLQGKWEYDIATGKVTWSPELFALLDWDINRGEPDYEQMLQLHVPEDRMSLRRVVERILQTGESYCVALRHPRPDGSLRYVESLGHLERDANGNPKRIYGITQDVSYRYPTETRINFLVQAATNFLILPTSLSTSQNFSGFSIVRHDLNQAYQDINS